jgi:hypothetical protein
MALHPRALLQLGGGPRLLQRFEEAALGGDRQRGDATGLDGSPLPVCDLSESLFLGNVVDRFDPTPK